MTTPSKTSGWAIASVAFGGASLLFGFLTGIPAIVCGHVARVKVRRSGGALTGSGLAFAGLITGYLLTLASAVMIPSVIIYVPGQAYRGRAKADVVSIVAALRQYDTEYGRYPAGSEKDGDRPSRDTTFGDGARGNRLLFNPLRAIAEGGNWDDRDNPRKIVFFEGRVVSNPAKPKTGFADGPEADALTRGSFFDPWGHEYLIRVDYDGDGAVEAPDGEKVKTGVIVWSLGKDGKEGTADDVVSWK